MAKQESLKNLKVFSKKLDSVIDFFPNNNRLVPADAYWLDSGWNNSVSSWVNEGWNNSISSWINEGWNNSVSSWVNEGWNNSTSSWTNEGWTNSGGGGGCYITTAAVDYMGLADDSSVLNLLRMYRDKLAEEDKEFKKVVLEYYKTAPMIVEKISSSDNKEEELNNIYFDMVIPVIELLEKGMIEEAKEYYIGKYNELKSKYVLEPQKQLIKNRSN